MQPEDPYFTDEPEGNPRNGGRPARRQSNRATGRQIDDHRNGGHSPIQYNHCLLAVYSGLDPAAARRVVDWLPRFGNSEKVLMFLAKCSDENFSRIIDHLHDQGYQLSKLRRETFVDYFNNIETNHNTFLIQDDEDFEKAFEVIRRAA